MNRMDTYKTCHKCGEPMIGIMKASDTPPFRAPRKVCEPCAREGKKVSKGGR